MAKNSDAEHNDNFLEQNETIKKIQSKMARSKFDYKIRLKLNLYFSSAADDEKIWSAIGCIGGIN